MEERAVCRIANLCASWRISLTNSRLYSSPWLHAPAQLTNDTEIGNPLTKRAFPVSQMKSSLGTPQADWCPRASFGFSAQVALLTKFVRHTLAPRRSDNVNACSSAAPGICLSTAQTYTVRSALHIQSVALDAHPDEGPTPALRSRSAPAKHLTPLLLSSWIPPLTYLITLFMVHATTLSPLQLQVHSYHPFSARLSSSAC